MKRLILAQLSACAAITGGVTNSCSDLLVGGADDRLILFNYDEVETLDPNGTNPEIIEDIVLAATKVGYVFEGKQQSNEAKQTLVKKKYSNSWDHEIVFKIFGATPAAKIQVEKFAAGAKLMALVQNNYKGTAGNGSFELYGVDTGLYLEAAERNVADTDTLGAFSITLKSSELFKEGHLPKTVFITDFATTKAMIDALL